MNRYRFLAFSVIGVLILGLSFFLWNRAQANLQLSTETGYEQNALSSKEEVSDDVTGNLPAEEPVEAGFANTETNSNLLDAKEIVHLLQNISNTRIVKPGWTYTEDKRIGDREMMMPGGISYPEVWYRIYWYHVNDDLLVDKFVFLDKGDQGDLFQITVFTDGYSWNSFYGDITAVKPFPIPKTFGDRMFDLVLSSKMTSTFVDLRNIAGNFTYVFSLPERIEKPVTIDYTSIGEVTIIGTIAEHYVDATTGFLERSAFGVILADDDGWVMIHESYYKIEYNVQPPQEIFDLIEKYRVSK